MEPCRTAMTRLGASVACYRSFRAARPADITCVTLGISCQRLPSQNTVRRQCGQAALCWASGFLGRRELHPRFANYPPAHFAKRDRAGALKPSIFEIWSKGRKTRSAHLYIAFAMCGQKGTAPILKPSKRSARKIVISNDNPLGDCLRPAPLITMGEGTSPSIHAPLGPILSQDRGRLGRPQNPALPIKQGQAGPAARVS